MFGSKTKEKEIESHCKRYLAVAPPGARTEVLAVACVHRCKDWPVASTEMFGQPLAASDLAPLSQVARDVLGQDRDLTGPVVRKAMQHLHAVASGFMTGPGYPENLGTVFSAAGLVVTDSVGLDPSTSETISPTDAEVAVSYGSLALSILRTVALGPKAVSAHEFEFYGRFFTRTDDDDIEALSYDLIAWEGVVLARLSNTERIRPGLPTMTAPYSRVPTMDQAGWYPNPTKVGEIVNGEPALQRYWNGNAWTDQVRMRERRRWNTASVSLHSPPVD